MNKFLLQTSIFCGIFMLIIINIKYIKNFNLLYFFICIGIITSIINHGKTGLIYKYMDRIIIFLNIIIFLYFIIKKTNEKQKKILMITIIVIIILLYLYSKLLDNIDMQSYIHSLSHFLSVYLLFLIH